VATLLRVGTYAVSSRALGFIEAKKSNLILRLGGERYKTYREPHVLGGNTTPEPWIKLFYASRGGLDVGDWTLADVEALGWPSIPVDSVDADDGEIVRDGLRAMCLQASLVDHSYRVRERAPASPVWVDFTDCRLQRRVADPLDTAPPAYFLPPAVARLWRDAGYVGIEIELDTLAAIGPVAECLISGQLPPRSRCEGGPA
jgi:hypothetical protein